MAKPASSGSMTAAALLVLACWLTLAPDACQAQQGSTRLFIADNNINASAIIVMDLPSMNVVHRLQTPGPVASMGLALDRQHLALFGARANAVQYVTVLNTGLRLSEPSVRGYKPLVANASSLAAPLVVKNVMVVNGTDALGGTEYGQWLTYHEKWKRYLMYAEHHGLIMAYRNSALKARNALRPLGTASIPVGHFHVLPYGNHIFAPHTTGHAAVLVNRSGVVQRMYECTACHGAAIYETKEMRAAVFGCNTTVIVVRGEGEPEIIPAANPRIGTFVEGAPGVFYTPAPTFFYRTDVRGDKTNLTQVQHRGSPVARSLSLWKAQRFLALHRDGVLSMYDGQSGNEVATLKLFDALPVPMTAHMGTADEGLVYVTSPANGTLHEVQLGGTTSAPTLTVLRVANVGGVPASMALAVVL